MKCNRNQNTICCLTHWNNSQQIFPFYEDSNLFEDVFHSHVLSMSLKGLACSRCDISKSDLANEKGEVLCNNCSKGTK